MYITLFFSDCQAEKAGGEKCREKVSRFNVHGNNNFTHHRRGASLVRIPLLRLKLFAVVGESTARSLYPPHTVGASIARQNAHAPPTYTRII